MEKRIFRRTFYKSLAYMKCDTEEELIAEKYILFVDSNNGVLEQVAMDIYFTYNRNPRFISILRDKYFYDIQDFLDLMGSGGLQKQWGRKSREEGKFSPAMILLNSIDSKKIFGKTIWIYSVIALCLIYGIAPIYMKEEGNNLKGSGSLL